MSDIPILPYHRIIKALQRAGWTVVRQRGSHIRLHKRESGDVMKLTVPAHNPIKSGTLRQILKHAKLTIEEFEQLL